MQDMCLPGDKIEIRTHPPTARYLLFRAILSIFLMQRLDVWICIFLYLQQGIRESLFEYGIIFQLPHLAIYLSAIVIEFLVRLQWYAVIEMSYYIVSYIHSAIITVITGSDIVSEIFIDSPHTIAYADIPCLTDMEGFIGIRAHILYQNFFTSQRLEA